VSGVADPVEFWGGCARGAQQHVHALHAPQHRAGAAGVRPAGGVPADHSTRQRAHVPGVSCLFVLLLVLMIVRVMAGALGTTFCVCLLVLCALLVLFCHSIGLGPLVSDLLVAFLLITAYGSVLMCQVRLFCLHSLTFCRGTVGSSVTGNVRQLRLRTVPASFASSACRVVSDLLVPLPAHHSTRQRAHVPGACCRALMLIS
jgi:hypothetical protein